MAKGFQNSVKATEKRNHPQLTSSFLEESFLQNFSALNDPRIERSKEHLLIDIVAISILVRRLHQMNTAKNHPNKSMAIEKIVDTHNLTDYEFRSFRSDKY